MSVVGMWGFETGSLEMEGLFTLSTVPSYLSGSPPAGGSIQYIRGNLSASITTLGGDLVKPVTDFWYTFDCYSASSTGITNYRVGWMNDLNAVGGYFSFNGSHQPQIWVNGVLVTTGTEVFGLEIWRKVHVHVVIDASVGTVDVYWDGNLTTPVASFSGNTENGVVAATRAYLRLDDPQRLDNVVYIDPTDATGLVAPSDFQSLSIAPKLPQADGDLVQWTATPGHGADYTDINEPVGSVASTATGRFTLNSVPADGETVTLHGKVYTFKTAPIADVDGYIAISTVAVTLDNLHNAINLTGTPGTSTYAPSTTLHPTITATTNASTYEIVDAKTSGSVGNTYDVSTTCADPLTQWVNETTLDPITFLVGGDDASDDSFVRATAVAQTSVFGCGTVTEGALLAVKGMYRILRGDTTAGSQFRAVGRQAGTSYPKADQAAPVDGYAVEHWDLAPDGSAWDNAKYAASQFGLESRT